MKGFQDKTIRAIKRRIQAEPICGLNILCVDGRRVGHALEKKDVKAMKHYLAHCLEDLENLFTDQPGAMRRNW